MGYSFFNYVGETIKYKIEKLLSNSFTSGTANYMEIKHTFLLIGFIPMLMSLDIVYFATKVSKSSNGSL